MPAEQVTTVFSRTTVRLPETVHRRAKLAAAWSGRKLQDFVAAAVEAYVVPVEDAMRISSKPVRRADGPRSKGGR